MDLARELKKVGNHEGDVIVIVIGVLAIFLKSLKKKLSEPTIRGRNTVIQTTTLKITMNA